MRTFTLLFSALVLGSAAKAQTVSTFETQPLATADTYYVNYTQPGMDVGFNDGLAHFPCVYDTAYGGLWSTGFAYTNKTDSGVLALEYTNLYTAKAAKGYGGSAKYVVAECTDPVTYQSVMRMQLTGIAVGHQVSGFYITNSSYAYNSMLYGDSYPGKKFGGTTGNDSDWLKLTVHAFYGGVMKATSVDFYLADYRFAHNDSDYILKTWQWVNLLPLGDVDSLQFNMYSNDTNASGLLNTPSYFCIDNFTTNESSVSVKNTPAPAAAKVYPNPATNTLYVDLMDNTTEQVVIMDMTGNIAGTYKADQKHLAINTSSLAAGMYILQLNGNGKTATTRFVKQ